MHIYQCQGCRNTFVSQKPSGCPAGCTTGRLRKLGASESPFDLGQHHRAFVATPDAFFSLGAMMKEMLEKRGISTALSVKRVKRVKAA